MILLRMPLLSRLSVLFALAMVMVAVQPSLAANEVTVSGGIQVLNEGKLSVTFGSGEIVFVTEDGGPAGVSSASGDYLYGQVPVAIEDTRAIGSRHGYSISLKMESPTMGQYYVDAANIVVIGTSELPVGLSKAYLGEVTGVVQDTPILAFAEDADPVSGTYLVEVQMYMPPGTVPGEYVGSVRISVNPDSVID